MQNIRGSIALTSVLVISAMFVLTAIVIIFQAMDFANSTSSYTNQIYAQNTAFTCLEESYYKISREPEFGVNVPGEFEIEIDENRKCSAIVENTSNNNRVIRVNSEYRSANYSTQKTIVDINAEEWEIN